MVSGMLALEVLRLKEQLEGSLEKRIVRPSVLRLWKAKLRVLVRFGAFGVVGH